MPSAPVFFAGQRLTADELNAIVNATTVTFGAFPSNTTWAIPAGAKHLLIIGVSPGGAGGGAPLSTAGNCSSGGGGGAGAEGFTLQDVANLTSPLQLITGTGGTGVSGAAGNSGGTLTVKDNNGTGATLLSITGGTGGTVLANGSAVTGLDGQPGGQVTVGQPGGARGQKGQATWRMSTTFCGGGDGGSTRYGMGGTGFTSSSASQPGTAGSGWGAGGGGARSNNGSGGPFAGGNGANGLIMIYVIY